MRQIQVPLFPLNTVLFPRMPLPLHVFEERFRKMIARCVEENSPFGVVLARDPEERGDEIARVGTVARIHVAHELEGGRYNVLAVGDERFAVLGRERTSDDYDVAFGETLIDLPTNPEHLEPLISEVKRLFGRYFDALIAKAGLQTPGYEPPDDPSALSFVVASVIQLPLERRQQFLESTSTSERLQQEIALLQRGVKKIIDSEAAAQVARPLDSAKAREEISRN